MKMGPLRSWLMMGAGIAAGAGGAFLLDPQQGKRRRHTIRDRTLARLRRGKRELGKQAEQVVDRARGVVAEAMPSRRDSSQLNEPTLAAKVESELFKPAGSPKGSVDVNVEGHVVFLRGEVASEEQLRELVERAEAVDGVARTESLLHVAGGNAGRGSA